MSHDRIVEVNKFNPYHDVKGRFATANSATSFTYAPGKSKAHDNAIAREKERQAAAANSGTRIDGVDIADKLPEPINEKISSLPELQGTPKQVEWAKKIRMEAAKKIQAATYDRLQRGGDAREYAKAMKSKEAMADFIRADVAHRGKYLNDTGKQNLIDGDCENFRTLSQRYSTAKTVLANDSAKFWIDNQLHLTNGLSVSEVLAGKRTLTNSGNKSSGSPSSSSGGGSSGKLVIPRGGKLPSDLSGVNRISGDTYANKDKIKAAGFKWDSKNKEWVRPGVAKSAESLLDDCPYDHIIEAGET